MRREHSLTFQGALEILGHREHKLIERLDKALGGVILAAGAGAGIAAIGPASLAPLAMFSAVWGWVEQKNLAISLLKQLVDKVKDHLVDTSGYERRQLIMAAHTTIVMAGLFEALREHVGRDADDSVNITNTVKEAVLAGKSVDYGKGLIERLYKEEVPAPSAFLGFEENVGAIHGWYSNLQGNIAALIFNRFTRSNLQIDWPAVVESAVERYRSYYLSLAATVPEFLIWAMLGEHAATRAAVAGLRADLAAALDGERDALSRVEALLTFTTAGTGAVGGEGEKVGARVTVSSPAMSDLRQRVVWANEGILDDTIVLADARTYGPDITFPKVRDIYINPRCRAVLSDNFGSNRPADETWWAEQEQCDNFDLMLAAYVTSPNATRLPMLLLGHPGAGKSLLTKVLAARLPTSDYTVVRVPLRRVGANAPVIDQVQEALHLATNRRVEWGELAEQSKETVRVVLLDGLDELLQASQNDRSGYLQEVAEFQRCEADQKQPVIVIVTSRTVVADRVDIPPRTAIVKLDTFNDTDIDKWIGHWCKANEIAIATGKMRALTVSGARRQPELSAQPLLLLTLALYSADPDLPPLDAPLSTADLYGRLFESFARREAAKDLNHDLRREDLDQRAQDHLDRLAIAALAMFNRGRQEVSEEELGKDLEILDRDLMTRSRPVEAGQRIIAEFFFVHAPEARTLTRPHVMAEYAKREPATQEQPRRAYEFMHATFGEYLVARRVMDEIIELAEKASASRRSPTRLDDDLLYALLSCQPLSAQRATLDFASQIHNDLPGVTRERILNTLELLIGNYRTRHDSGQYFGYRPIPPDYVHQLACYSANLVALRVAFVPEGGSTSLTRLMHTSDNALEMWQSMVMLWRAGLDANGIQAMVGELDATNDPVGIRSRAASKDIMQVNSYGDPAAPILEIGIARLLHEPEMQLRLRYGTAITDRTVYSVEGESWADTMASWLIPVIAGRQAPRVYFDPPAGTPDADIALVADLIFRFLRIHRHYSSTHEALLRILFNMPQVFRIDQLALAAAVLSDPGLRAKIPELSDLSLYGDYAELISRVRRKSVKPRDIDVRKLPDEAIESIRTFLTNPPGS